MPHHIPEDQGQRSPLIEQSDSGHAGSSHAGSNQAGNAQGPNVAVIAIHGVGRHAPGASAEAVATLLLSIDKAGKEEGSADEPTRADEAKKSPLYSGFEIKSVDVALRHVLSPPEDAENANERHQQGLFARLWGLFDERRGFLSETRKGKGGSPVGYDTSELRKDEPDRGNYAYRFMDHAVGRLRGRGRPRLSDGSPGRETESQFAGAHGSHLRRPLFRSFKAAK